MSVCLLKVQLTLLANGFPYERGFVDLRRGKQFDPGYLKIYLGAVVPVLFHEGHRRSDPTGLWRADPRHLLAQDFPGAEKTRSAHGADS